MVLYYELLLDKVTYDKEKGLKYEDIETNETLTRMVWVIAFSSPDSLRAGT
jgi:hypothetical protein